MSIVFLIPYVPIPRMVKRITTACCVDSTSVIFWDRGTEVVKNLDLPQNVRKHRVFQIANEGQPLKRLGATLWFCKKAFLLLKEERPSCIHVTKTDMLLLVWFYCVTRRKRPHVIYEVSDIHAIALNDNKSFTSVLIKGVLRMAERVGTSVVDRLIVTSESFWSVYYKPWILKEFVLFLPNAPQERVFDAYRPKRGGRFQLGFIGKIRYKEQLKLMVDAAQQADIDVLIAGNGVDLRAITDYCRGMQNVTIHGAYEYEREIASLYGKIDCVYSMYDTSINNVRIALPNRLYEATFCGLPLIVSKGTELADIVENEELGIVVTDGDINALVGALERLKNDSYRNRLAEKSKAYYQKWRYEATNHKLFDAYKDLTINTEE